MSPPRQEFRAPPPQAIWVRRPPPHARGARGRGWKDAQEEGGIVRDIYTEQERPGHR